METSDCGAVNCISAELDTQTFAGSFPIDEAELVVDWIVMGEEELDHFTITYSDNEGHECKWGRGFNPVVDDSECTEYVCKWEAEGDDPACRVESFPEIHAHVIHEITYIRLPECIEEWY